MAYSLLAVDFLPPSVIQTTLMKVATALSAGVIAPLRRIMHSMGTVASAFRQMIQATHVGKVVTSTRPVAEADIAVPKSMPSIAVTGGSGGLGLMISQWLVGRLGPVYLHLISRGGRITDASARSELALSCASITTAMADASVPADLEWTLPGSRSGQPQLQMLLHASGILRVSHPPRAVPAAQACTGLFAQKLAHRPPAPPTAGRHA